MTDHKDNDPLRTYKEFDEKDPAFQVRILSIRIDVLTKEKEKLEVDLGYERDERKLLEVRVAKMEKSFQRGTGMMVMFPIIGTIAGIVFAYAKVLFGGGK